MTVNLPWPPSVNHYWRYGRGHFHISSEGKTYRQRVFIALRSVGAHLIEGRIGVRVKAHPPDRRVRDLDNILKALLDALKTAGAYTDDGQIDAIQITRESVQPEGSVRVEVERLGEQ